MPHACHLHSSSLTPPLCLTPVQCPDLEISTLRLPGSGARVPRRAHLSDDCSVPAIVRSSAPHCRSFDSNGAVLGPKFQKLPHNPSHLGACKAQVDELGGFKPLQCLSVGWPSVIWCMWAPKQQSNNGITIALLHAAGNCLDPISPVRTVRQYMKMVRLMPITSITGVTIQLANNT